MHHEFNEVICITMQTETKCGNFNKKKKTRKNLTLVSNERGVRRIAFSVNTIRIL